MMNAINEIKDKIGTCDHCGGQTFDGNCTRVMQRRFDAVKDAADWRGPIDKIIPREALSDTVAAIAFYTATEAEWVDAQTVRGVRMVRPRRRRPRVVHPVTRWVESDAGKAEQG